MQEHLLRSGTPNLFGETTEEVRERIINAARNDGIALPGASQLELLKAYEIKSRFNFTTAMAERFEALGITLEQRYQFTKGFDDYLARMADTENLIALGILAIPGKESMTARALVDKEGVVLDIVGYWSKPQGRIDHDKDWVKLAVPEGRVGHRTITPAFFQSFSPENYPTLEAFQMALLDEGPRSDMTFTGVNCEFWGFVTTEQLRQEMGVKS